MSRSTSVRSDFARASPAWGELLIEAVEKPGMISSAYSRFWNYSVGNQLLAHFQCLLRGIEPGPLNTFLGWKDLGRSVKKGEKALTLCMPVSVKCKSEHKDEAEAAAEESVKEERFTRFIYRPHWFVLCQTEGAEYVPTEVPAWSEPHALSELHVERVAFTHTDGNALGFARVGQVSVSPLSPLPHKTLFHELAHVVLGHVDEVGGMDDGERTPVSLREVEAECVALICCESLSLPGAEFSRGYIQHWLGKETIPERSAQKIFKAADQILRAGRDGAPRDVPPQPL